jgi:hypothetical protein
VAGVVARRGRERLRSDFYWATTQDCVIKIGVGARGCVFVEVAQDAVVGHFRHARVEAEIGDI